MTGGVRSTGWAGFNNRLHSDRFSAASQLQTGARDDGDERNALRGFVTPWGTAIALRQRILAYQSLWINDLAEGAGVVLGSCVMRIMLTSFHDHDRR